MSVHDQHDGDGEAIGQLLDSLGVKHELDEGDMVTDAVVITKVVRADGSVRLGLTWSEGMSWIERLGMITAAKQIDSPMFSLADDDDD